MHSAHIPSEKREGKKSKREGSYPPSSSQRKKKEYYTFLPVMGNRAYTLTEKRGLTEDLHNKKSGKKRRRGEEALFREGCKGKKKKVEGSVLPVILSR